MLPAGRRVENVWMTLEQRGAPPAELLSADIYDSWMRCISFGLDTLRPPSPNLSAPQSCARNNSVVRWSVASRSPRCTRCISRSPAPIS